MKYRKLKSINKEVSEIGIGLWSLVSDEWGQIDNKEEIINHAFNNGINFFDTADIYGKGEGEKLLGKIFKNNRDEIVILTKIGYDLKTNKRRFDLNYLKNAINDSLGRLNTSYIDILMLHNPTMEIIKNNEILEFLRDLKIEGKILSYGISLGPTLGWEDEGIKAIEMGYKSLEHIYNIIEREPGQTFLKFDDIDHFIRVPHASDVLDDRKWPLKFDNRLHRKFKDMKWIQEALKCAEELKKRINRLKLYETAIIYVLSNRNVSSVVPNITFKEEIDLYSKLINDNVQLSENELQIIDYMYNICFRKLNEESIEETKLYK